MPILGYLSDKIGFEYQCVLLYGARLITVVSFFFMEAPVNEFARWIVILIVTFSYGEQLVIYSFFTKRLPGDVRGVMRGIFYSWGHAGQILMSFISIIIVNHGFSLQSPFSVVAALDAFVVFFSMMMGCVGIFNED